MQAYSRAVVKVCVDSQRNNKKTVLYFKMGDFAKFRQITSNINIFARRMVFSLFVSFSPKTKSFGAYACTPILSK